MSQEIEWNDVVLWAYERWVDTGEEWVDCIDCDHPNVKYLKNWKILKYCLGTKYKWNHIERNIDDIHYLNQLNRNIWDQLYNLHVHGEYWTIEEARLSCDWEEKYIKRLKSLRKKIAKRIAMCDVQEPNKEKLEKIIYSLYCNAFQDQEENERQEFINEYNRKCFKYADGEYWAYKHEEVSWEDMDEKTGYWTNVIDKIVNKAFPDVVFGPMNQVEQLIILDALRSHGLIDTVSYEQIEAANVMIILSGEFCEPKVLV